MRMTIFVAVLALMFLVIGIAWAAAERWNL